MTQETISQKPPKTFATPFADSGDRNAIPDTGVDAVNIQQGFPSIFSTPRANSGKSVARRDMNGILNSLSSLNYYFQYMGRNPWVSGTSYPKGAKVWYDNAEWISPFDNNTTAPGGQNEDGEDAWIAINDLGGTVGGGGGDDEVDLSGLWSAIAALSASVHGGIGSTTSVVFGPTSNTTLKSADYKYVRLSREKSGDLTMFTPYYMKISYEVELLSIGKQICYAYDEGVYTGGGDHNIYYDHIGCFREILTSNAIQLVRTAVGSGTSFGVTGDPVLCVRPIGVSNTPYADIHGSRNALVSDTEVLIPSSSKVFLSRYFCFSDIPSVIVNIEKYKTIYEFTPTLTTSRSDTFDYDITEDSLTRRIVASGLSTNAILYSHSLIRSSLTIRFHKIYVQFWSETKKVSYTRSVTPVNDGYQVKWTDDTSHAVYSTYTINDSGPFIR